MNKIKNLKMIAIYKAGFWISLLFLIGLFPYSHCINPIKDLVKDYVIPLSVVAFSFGQLLNSEKNRLFEIMKHNREIKSKFTKSLATLENDSSWENLTHSQVVDFKNRAYCLHREASVFFRNTPALVEKTKDLKNLYWKHVEAIQITGNNNTPVNRSDGFQTIFDEIYDLLMTDEETKEWKL